LFLDGAIVHKTARARSKPDVKKVKNNSIFALFLHEIPYWFLTLAPCLSESSRSCPAAQGWHISVFCFSWETMQSRRHGRTRCKRKPATGAGCSGIGAEVSDSPRQSHR
jgi:hypothetical protein